MEKKLVNPIALQDCSVKAGDSESRVLDISFVRIVVETPATPFPEGVFPVELVLGRYRFNAKAEVKGEGDGWIRLGLEKMLPSSRAHMRSFLSPKKIGESLLEDWRRENVRHYHGLNESELWFDPDDGGVLFTYLDQLDLDSQFLIRMTDKRGALHVGKILRKDYMELSRIDSEFPVLPLNDREVYARLGETRDIVTNFRPLGQLEYHLKQRLLKVISETLYSTSHRVEMSQSRSPRTVSMSVDA